MKLKAYEKLLDMSKEAVEASLAPIRARSAKKKAELEIAKLEEKEATLESELTEICSVKDVNFERIISKLDEIDLAVRRKKQFTKIVEEMFPS